MGHHLVVAAYVRRPKIDQDVYDERHVHCVKRTKTETRVKNTWRTQTDGNQNGRGLNMPEATPLYVKTAV